MNRTPWRERRNRMALESLLANVTDHFPDTVWRHALALRFIPDTLTGAVESYWRAHPARADRLARALAARSGAPQGWSWTLDVDRRDGLPTHFRRPPAPYREAAFSRGHGFCCVCGQPVFRYGWHRDLWGDGRPSRRATWHQACAVAWKLWTAPHIHAAALKRLQRFRCAVTGKRLPVAADVDHRVPLFRVWRDHRREPWPGLLGYWGVPNLQVMSRLAHRSKCAVEVDDRVGRATGLAAAGTTRIGALGPGRSNERDRRGPNP
jgi:hypothetical protein